MIEIPEFDHRCCWIETLARTCFPGRTWRIRGMSRIDSMAEQSSAPRRPLRHRASAATRTLNARQVRSPNRDARSEAGTTINLAVVHGISLPPGEFGGDGAFVRLFTNRLDAQAHPSYTRGRHTQGLGAFPPFDATAHSWLEFVGCFDRAWHAGVSAWKGRERCNDFSVEIQLEGTDAIPYAPAQYTMLARLIRALRARLPDRGHRRSQRYRAGAQDRPRPGVRLGPPSSPARAAAPIAPASPSATRFRHWRSSRDRCLASPTGREPAGQGILVGLCNYSSIFSLCCCFSPLYLWQGIFFRHRRGDGRLHRSNHLGFTGSTGAPESCTGYRW